MIKLQKKEEEKEEEKDYEKEDEKDYEKEDEKEDENENEKEDKNKKNKKSKNTLKCIIQEPEYIHLSKNNAKKLWTLESEYINNNKEKYSSEFMKKQLKILKNIRNVKLTKEDMELFGEEKKKTRSKDKLNTMMDIGDVLINTNYYNKDE